MAQNNLRVVFKNAATAVGGSSTSAALNDFKSSTTVASSSYTVTTSSLSGPVCVMAMVAEYTGALTMTVSTQSSADTSTSQVSNSQPTGYGGVKYMAVYFPNLGSTSSFTISFSQAVKLSRVVIGNYWQPQYNTQYGASVGFNDLSEASRLQSGDLYTQLGPRHKTLSFSLDYISEQDKFKLFDLVRGVGKSTGVFVSLFPQDADKEKEQMYQIYGKFQNLPQISHTIFTMYASSLELEEI